ncbi:MAG: DUF983 domain-containing protein [Pseudomonadota bacterium]
MLNTHPIHSDIDDDRSVKLAMKAGWKGHCPNCEQGRMFRSYLSVQPECLVCGEELHHQRADDGPAYLTILISGHILAPLMHIAFVWLRPDPIAMGVAFSLIFLVMALTMLPRLKGALIGYQWAKRMHGFGVPDQSATRVSHI